MLKLRFGPVPGVAVVIEGYSPRRGEVGLATFAYSSGRVCVQFGAAGPARVYKPDALRAATREEADRALPGVGCRVAGEDYH